MRNLHRLALLWPLRITYEGRSVINNSTDQAGRRYGDFVWLTVSFGHVHFAIFPKHIRRVWTSIFWRESRDG